MRLLGILAVAALGVIASIGGLSACATQEIAWPRLRESYELPSSHYLQMDDGVRLHYTEDGNPADPTLVLVHGFAASVHAWRPWVDRLKDSYHLVALDLPGHGLTETPRDYRASVDGNVELVDRLARHLNVDRFVLAGNSMGGAVSIDYALTHPERLRGLVLVDAAGWPGDAAKSGSGPPLVFQLMNNPIGRGILKWFDPRMFATGGLKAAYVDPNLVNKALVDRYANLALAPGHRDVLLTMNNQPSAKITATDFGRISTPTLVIAGEQDKIIPVADSRAIAAAIPNAKLVTYPDGGHVPMEQLPDQSAKDLRAFLESLKQP
ncbi:MAG TPA: alpha/beta hydrolase [Hyphomonadaceae bacterium]|nr:alpha/beta hydrolase [Hyphomonadaceae bacterium]